MPLPAACDRDQCWSARPVSLPDIRRNPALIPFFVFLRLPDMSGLELVKRLTSAHPSLPIIMVSGYSDQMFRRKALDAGARDYLEKEKTPDVLIETIRHLLA